MFERFTERARLVVKLAQDEARERKHNYIGTEHLLIGLLREHGGLGARVLRAHGVDLDPVREKVLEIVGQGEEVTAGQIPFTPRTQKVLELALREALSLGHNYIGTEHILLGMVREGEGVAWRILSDFVVDGEQVRAAVIRQLNSTPPSPTRSLPPNFRGLEPLTVFRVTTLEGQGSNGDVAREVRRYFTEDGELLFTDDPTKA